MMLTYYIVCYTYTFYYVKGVLPTMLAIMILSSLIIFFAGLYVYNRYVVRKSERQFPPAGQFVTVNGLKQHYVSHGEGVPVVCLHGGILSWHDYAGVLELAPPGYRWLAFDRSGHGYSERAATAMTPIDQARLLRDTLQELGIEKPILVGHSWSGSLVLAYALEYPEELGGIVLLAPAAYGGEAYPASSLDELLYRLIRMPAIGPFLLRTLLVLLGRGMTRSMVKGAFANDLVPDEYLQRAAALFPRPEQLRANREDVHTFRPAVESFCSRYGEIQVPVTIVVGEDDPFNVEDQSYRLHQEIPHSKLKVLADTGHMIPQRRPEAVIEAVHEMVQG